MSASPSRGVVLLTGPWGAAAADAIPFRPGDVLAGKFLVDGVLGEGGIGYVLAVRHLQLGQRFAMKLLRPSSARNEDLVARFSREAVASVNIRSDHVPRVYDVGQLADGTPFLVMELFDGKDLGQVLSEQGRLDCKTAVDYVMQACEALAAAHACGIIHRDVKPENLFLAKQPHGPDIIKLLDFGISKLALTGQPHVEASPLATIAPIGTPLYMSPEQIRAEADIDVRTDIWSLGVVLHELLTGQGPFVAGSITQVTVNILEGKPVSLEGLSEVPSELARIVARCLEKDKRQRFADVGEMTSALMRFGSHRGRLSAQRTHAIFRTAPQTAHRQSGAFVAVRNAMAVLTPHPEGGHPRASAQVTTSPEFTVAPAQRTSRAEPSSPTMNVVSTAPRISQSESRSRWLGRRGLLILAAVVSTAVAASVLHNRRVSDASRGTTSIASSPSPTQSERANPHGWPAESVAASAARAAVLAAAAATGTTTTTGTTATTTTTLTAATSAAVADRFSGEAPGAPKSRTTSTVGTSTGAGVGRSGPPRVLPSASPVLSPSTVRSKAAPRLAPRPSPAEGDEPDLGY